MNENNYKCLVQKVLDEGMHIKGRNGDTIELFGTSLTLDVHKNKLPMLTGRKMYPKGIIGEFLALIQTDCKSVKDFESRGCNYWELWSTVNGKLNLDYPPGRQLDDVIKSINKDPHSRRHMINLWNPSNIKNLSLPCCHYNYQFNIQNENINMVWTQRSADIMVGVPSDMVLATLYLHIVGEATGYTPNKIVMHFGSTHIYKEHIPGLEVYMERSINKDPLIFINGRNYKDLTQNDFNITDYYPKDPIKFQLKA